MGNIAITTRVAEPSQRRQKPSEDKLGFGKYFSDHMLKVWYDEGRGWHDAVIEPYGPLPLDPAAQSLHYGQLIFEGLKAFRNAAGKIVIFRPRDSVARLSRSAARMCMPAVDDEFLLDGLKQLVRLDADWVPSGPDSSLYIRPTMIAVEASLGVKVASSYLLYVITSPSGPYYAEGVKPTRILVTDKYTRVAPGGTGEAKTAGNYAASLLAYKEAKEAGFTQVLWLDAVERKWVEEVGTSNICFVIGKSLVTPPLAGTILAGMTRNAVLRLARDWGVEVAERKISIDEVSAAAADGTLREMFATGTAAVISPVGEFVYRGEEYRLPALTGESLAMRLYDAITGIQRGRLADPYGWVEPID